MPPRSCFVQIAAALALGAACGCSGAALAEPSYVAADPAAQQQFDEARESYREGRAAEAEGRFSSFIVRHPEDPLRHGAELHLGRIAASRGDDEQATSWLGLAAGSGDPAMEAVARRELAAVLLRLGRPAEAIAALEPLVGRLDGAEAAAVYGTLVVAAEAAGDEVRLLRFLDARHRHEQDREGRDELERRALAVAGRMAPQQLDRLHAELPRTGPGWAAVTGRLAGLALGRGDEARAGALLEALERAGVPAGPATTELRATIEQVRQVDWSAVGVLVPREGRARLVGEQVLSGIRLAAAEGPRGEEPLRLAVRDTEGADLARLVDELVRVERVAAIVGPVDAAGAAAAAARAEQLGVPLLALTIRREVSEAGSFVLRPFQSNEAEVAALVDHAVEALRLRRFGVLYPEGPYGRTLRREVRDQVVARGGRVVAERSYDPSRTSFVEECRALAESDLQALVVPDRARAVSLIAPALAAAGLWSQPAGGRGGPSGTRPVQLLLPSAAFDASLPRQAGRYLQGALFATPLWTGDQAPATAEFVESFRAAHGSEPGPLSSQAHDAVQIVRAARDRARVRSRAGLLEALLALDHAETAGPFEGFDGRGEPTASVRLVTLEGEGYRPVSR